MYPELFEIPIIGYGVKSYGFMLMLGFLSGTWMAAKRAEKVRANPDLVINLAFCSLIGGVVGARLMYVIHYWQRDFAGRSNPLMAVIDISAGGMEFLGGVIGALVILVGYLLIMRQSIRLYFDLLTPSLIWGLAFGRMGCLLNGCCWGGVAGDTMAKQWALQFPYGSPAFVSQFHHGQLGVPAPLIVVNDIGRIGLMLDRDELHKNYNTLNQPVRAYEQAKLEYDYLSKADPTSVEAKKAQQKLKQLETAVKPLQQRLELVQRERQKYPSHEFPGQAMTPLELVELARTQHSLPVHPTQIYDLVNALLGSWFLVWLLKRRRHQGVVFIAMLLTYPWTRLVLETIRVDNPLDTFGGLTISQGISVVMFAIGIGLWLIWRRLPAVSPRAIPWIPPVEQNAQG
ncbi:MAG: Prolipoprotein diacylglyceryl transferase [Phycisphaerae bacterium]|nr:Prolipoprotein diacylglyceryl transferase [Phycisphaerae bacterium]